MGRIYGRAVGLFLAVTVMTSGEPVWAHGGVSMEDDRCVMRIGQIYEAHFTGYQPETHAAREFCEDVPVVGRATFVVDLLSPELRNMEVTFRILRDVYDLGYTATKENLGSQRDIENATLYGTKPQVYRRGTIVVEHEFSGPGMFIGLVTARDVHSGEVYVSVFPFAVGIFDFWGVFLPWGPVIILFGLGLGALAWRARRRQTHVEDASAPGVT